MAYQKVLTTALGNIIAVVPQKSGSGWAVFSLDRLGNFTSGSFHDNLESARAKRRWLFKHHRKLAKEWKKKMNKILSDAYCRC